MNKVRTFKIFRYCFFVCLLCILSGWSFKLPSLFHPQEEVAPLPKALLPTEGVLRQAPDGYIYLKVPNRYVYKLYPLVREKNFSIPYHLRRHTKVGAHISVFYKEEGRAIGPIRELGKTYHFTPKGVKKVRNGAKEYILLEVSSPELEQLRMRYGYSSKLLNHDFHLTLAERRV